MNKHEIEASLRRAGGQLPTPDYHYAAHTPVQPLEVHDHITRQTPAVRHRPPMRLPSLVAALCLLLCIGGGGWYYWANLMPWSTLYLEVNPSLAIVLNQQNKVLEVKAQNEAADELLEDRSYENWAFSTTLEWITDDMLSQGYLQDMDSLRIHAISKSEDRAKVLETEALRLIEAKVAGVAAPPQPTPSPTPVTTPSTPVMTPVMTPDITPNVTPSPTPSHHGNKGTSKPDGRLTPEEAKSIILAQEPSASIHKIKLEEDDNSWYYDMEVTVGHDTYDAEVHAITGAVIKWDLDD